MSKLRVGVFMGGKSIEREVSFNSGRTICDHLDTSRYTIIPIFQTAQGALFILPWRFLHRGKTSDFVDRLEKEAHAITWQQLKYTIDFMYIATHGRYAEDGTLQGFLEVLQIPYLGAKVAASALTRDKAFFKKFLQTLAIATPHGITLPAEEITTLSLSYIQEKLNQQNITLPCVVKPHLEGSSLGVSVVHEWQRLMPAIEYAAYVSSTRSQTVLIEQRIQGMEFCCIVLIDHTTGQPLLLPPTEIVYDPHTDFYDYDQKYMPGRSRKYTPARCNQEQIQKIQATCVQIMGALEIPTIVRIDGFLTPENTVVIIDMNTLTGMAPTSFLFRQAAEINMSHTDLINHLIETELANYNKHLTASSTSIYNHSYSIPERKMRIAVLLGGRSNEKEISLDSGRNIVYKLSPHKYQALPIFVDRNLQLYHLDQQLLVRHSTHEIEDGLSDSLRIPWDQLPEIADFVFIALHGGEGENGSIQGTLEMLGVPYNGSGVLTSALCMDKFRTNQYLKTQGFHVPHGLLVQRTTWEDYQDETLERIIAQFAFPSIVKPHDDGCSILVYKVHSIAELQHALTQIFNSGKTHALIEEYINGMELTVGVLGNSRVYTLPPSQAIAAQGILSIEEKFLPGAGENQTPAPLPQHTITYIQQVIAHVYAALNCKGYARIDCFYQNPEQSPTSQERVVIIEINTLPGMTPATCIFHQAAEVHIKPMDFIDLIVQLGLEQHGRASDYTLPLTITHYIDTSLHPEAALTP